ncbi:hypothetical protein IV203_026686 [Nitzschia inconspicua]|uniref:Uncharacterized protein n=1 Tax=Nitzschia inconspicua TaxID=303405 RepID=A0A9K3PXR8_9STRA|nr:hypothetical protein IV203_026686 [Nitzschia inconspicua]
MKNRSNHEQNRNKESEQQPPPPEELKERGELFDLLKDMGKGGKDISPRTALQELSGAVSSSQSVYIEPAPSGGPSPIRSSSSQLLLSADKAYSAQENGSPKSRSKRKRKTANNKTSPSRKKTKRSKTDAQPDLRVTACDDEKSLVNAKSTIQPPSREKDPAYSQEQTVNNYSILPTSVFSDTMELDRNVRMDFVTNRGYVYTTDMTDRGLPELLYMDVPNDDFAVSLCGRWITNQLLLALSEDIAEIGGRHRLIVRSCNLQMYQQDIWHPNTPDGSEGETVTVKFRLRAVVNDSKLHHMLAQNFFGRPCPKGIVVFLPCIKPNSPFHRFWGNSAKVSPLPEHNENLTLNRTDNYCKDFAVHYGRYCGSFCFRGTNFVISHIRQPKSPTSPGNENRKTKKSPSSSKNKPIKVKSKKEFIQGKRLLLQTPCAESKEEGVNEEPPTS